MLGNVFDFVGGENGSWKVVDIHTVTGEPILAVPFIKIMQASPVKPNEGVWTLRGFNSNVRYAEKAEKEQLTAIQADLGRKEATHAALIPIRKTEAWWALAQDERREIFEAQSHHTQTGLKYLPAIARKLYHCRDIGEPFDFLTWFEYSPADSNAFQQLVSSLRETLEWKYVDREIDIRLTRA